ncbi:hypothetical protein FXO38_15219 [Capsicum annuum]|nr:hypothetical protein FXO38_15219 [Capsicum annuum]
MKADGSLDRYKARLVAQGYNQEYGIDYEETFAPVAKMTKVRILLALASIRSWKLHQLDVKNVFLYGDLQEVIYMNLPPGYKHFSPNQVLSQFVIKPYKIHYSGLLRVIRYIKGTVNRSLLFPSSSSLDIVGYADADWAGCPDSRRSTTGWCMMLGSCMISWKCKKQSQTSKSSTKVEYRSMSTACSEIIWLRRLLSELGIKIEGSTILYGDNTSAIRIATNPVHHESPKHIDLDCHYIRELVEDRSINLRYISSKDQLADLFTKAMSRSRHNYLLSKLMFCDTEHKLEGGY